MLKVSLLYVSVFETKTLSSVSLRYLKEVHTQHTYIHTSTIVLQNYINLGLNIHKMQFMRRYFNKKCIS